MSVTLRPKEKKGSVWTLVLAMNTPLNTGYILKESIAQIWSKPNYEEAEASLDGWILSAFECGVPILAKLGRTIQKYSQGILNYFHHKVTSAPIECFNNHGQGTD
jgi:transposase